MKHYCKNNNDSKLSFNNVNQLMKYVKKDLSDKFEIVPISNSNNNSNNSNSNNNNNNNTNSHNNITNNITIKNFGQERMDHITREQICEYIKYPYDMIPKIVEDVHFNDKVPENKNLQLVNKKDKHIKVKENDEWNYKCLDETLFYLIDGKSCFIEFCFENLLKLEKTELDKLLTPSERKTYIKFRDEYDKIESNKKDNPMLKDLKKKTFLKILLCR